MTVLVVLNPFVSFFCGIISFALSVLVYRGERVEVSSFSRHVLCGNLVRRISWLNYDVSVVSAER